MYFCCFHFAWLIFWTQLNGIDYWCNCEILLRPVLQLNVAYVHSFPCKVAFRGQLLLWHHEACGTVRNQCTFIFSHLVWFFKECIGTKDPWFSGRDQIRGMWVKQSMWTLPVQVSIVVAVGRPTTVLLTENCTSSVASHQIPSHIELECRLMMTSRSSWSILWLVTGSQYLLFLGVLTVPCYSHLAIKKLSSSGTSAQASVNTRLISLAAASHPVRGSLMAIIWFQVEGISVFTCGTLRYEPCFPEMVAPSKLHCTCF